MLSVASLAQAILAQAILAQTILAQAILHRHGPSPLTLPAATWRFRWIRGRAIGSSQARSRAPLSRRDLLPALRSPSWRLRSPLLSWPAPRGRFARLLWLQRSAQGCHRRKPPPRTPTSSSASSRSGRVWSSTASSSRSMAPILTTLVLRTMLDMQRSTTRKACSPLRQRRTTPSPSPSSAPVQPVQQACRPRGLDVRRGPSSARRPFWRPQRLHRHRLPALRCPRRPPWVHGPFRHEWRRRLLVPAAPGSSCAPSRATSTALVHVARLLLRSLRGDKLRLLFFAWVGRM